MFHLLADGKRNSISAVEQIGHGAVGVQGDISNMADLDRLYEVIKQRDRPARCAGGQRGQRRVRAPSDRSPRRTSISGSASTSRERYSPCRRRCR